MYDSLPPRPDAPHERAIWDALDPLAPLGQPVATRIFGIDYAGYLVGYDHLQDLGSYHVWYEDGDHRHFIKRKLNDYLKYYDIMRNHSQPLAPEQNHDPDDQARDQRLSIFAGLVTVLRFAMPINWPCL